MTSNGEIAKLMVKLANFEIGKEFFDDVGKIAVESIHRNIEQQKQADGSQLQENLESTTERKRRLGRPQLSLVDAHKRFISKRKGWVVNATKKGVTVFPSSYMGGGKQTLKDLVRWLQTATRHRPAYTGWFAIDAKGVKAVRDLVRKRIKSGLRSR